MEADKKPPRKLKIKKRDTSNKGTSAKDNLRIKGSIKEKDIAYRNKYNPKIIISKPIIDKIVICGNPKNIDLQTDDTKLNKWLYFEAKLHEEFKNDNNEISLIGWDYLNKHPWTKNYKYHFKITPPNSDESILFFFAQKHSNPGQRFLRIEFNPWKLGKENVEWFINFYNGLIPSNSFADLITQANCINRLDIAIDVIGVHIADLILNKNKGKSHRWYAAEGPIESYYFDAKAGKPSKIKAYNKKQEHAEKEDRLNKPLYGGKNVTRVEASLNRVKLPINKLHELINHFASVKLPYPKDMNWTDRRTKHLMPRNTEHVKLVLESLRSRGEEATYKTLSEDQREAYQYIFKLGLNNILSEYNNTDNWKHYWQECLKSSGLLYGLSDTKS